jgi:hypothetical protein
MGRFLSVSYIRNPCTQSLPDFQCCGSRIQIDNTPDFPLFLTVKWKVSNRIIEKNSRKLLRNPNK